MNFKPILFSSEMVRAILDKRKTQTRRICKPQPLSEHVKDGVRYFKIPAWPNLCEKEFIDRLGRWSVGDVLWVRESVFEHGKYISSLMPSGEYKTTWRPSWPRKISYVSSDSRPEKWTYRTKPSIHMPKSACRIFLQITDIRVERVQDISEEDAIAEGVHGNCVGITQDCIACRGKGKCQGKDEWFHYTRGLDDFPAYSAVESFHSLWEKINGRESLVANPWVWAISFNRIDKPENF